MSEPSDSGSPSLEIEESFHVISVLLASFLRQTKQRQVYLPDASRCGDP